MASHDSTRDSKESIALPVERPAGGAQIDRSPRGGQRGHMKPSEPPGTAGRPRRPLPPVPAGLDLERALTTDETSAVLGHSPVTLQQWRQRGEGPRWWRCGRSIRYTLRDVLAFRDARMVGKAS